MGIENLSEMYQAISMARENNSKTFDYIGNNTLFKSGLKEYLKMHFGKDIKFDREETFAYIQAHYKNVGIEINVWDGIILTIEDEKSKELSKDFEVIFSNIVGLDKICSYDFCTNYNLQKTIYPTFEWNLNPERRLYELVNRFGIVPGSYVQNLEDNYTSSIIENLGNNLLTLEGYIELFGNSSYPGLKFHKIREIQKQHPTIKDYMISSWIDISKENLSLVKKVG